MLSAGLRQVLFGSATPYRGAMLALDFAGSSRTGRRPYYMLNGRRYARISDVPGWTYTGGTAAGTGSYAARQDGSLQFFPSYTNLLLQSQTLDNAGWVKTDTTITANAVAAPDGTTTADLVTEGSAGTALLFSPSATISPSVQNVESFYLKRGNTDWIRLRFFSNDGTNGVNAWFNLATGAAGTTTTTGSPTNVALVASDAGGGWYRMSITATLSTFTTANLSVASATSNGATGRVSGATYYAWGAQLELGSTASTYIPTTTAAVTVGTPRITDAGYWAEEARTNLLLNSATLSTQSVTVTAVAHTLSFYGTGTVTLTGVSTAGPLVGTGASNRVTLTFTPTAGSLTLTVSGSVTIAQLEAGSFATSPIPTTSVAVTRAADVGYVSGLVVPMSAVTMLTNSLIGPAMSNAGRVGDLSDGTNDMLVTAFGGTNQASVAATGVSLAAVSSAQTAGQIGRVAVKLEGTAVTASGLGEAATSVAGTYSGAATATRLYLGNTVAGTRPHNTAIRRIVIYPRAFGNAELQAITLPTAA